MQNSAFFSSHFYRISLLWQCPATCCCSAGFVCSFIASGPTWFLHILSYGCIYKEDLKLLYPSEKSKEKKKHGFFTYLPVRSKEEKAKEMVKDKTCLQNPYVIFKSLEGPLSGITFMRNLDSRVCVY